MTGRCHYWLPVLAVLALAQCSFEKHKLNAEAVMEQYFEAVRSKSFEYALTHFSPTFFQKYTPPEWAAVLRNVNVKLGDFQSKKLVGWRVYSGPQTFCRLTYEVTYSRGNATEDFTLTYDRDGQFRIVDHKIESKALLMG